MLDYVDCNIQAYILYVINADNALLFYKLYMIILVCTALHNAFVFYEALYHKRFFSVCCSSYTLFDAKCILLVYYVAKYIVFNYFIPRLPE